MISVFPHNIVLCVIKTVEVAAFLKSASLLALRLSCKSPTRVLQVLMLVFSCLASDGQPSCICQSQKVTASSVCADLLFLELVEHLVVALQGNTFIPLMPNIDFTNVTFMLCSQVFLHTQ